jgi:predicted PhzF superfamily epimerase YddE/YHI9
LFQVRNAFAVGGVLEDPATGAAAAVFAGYLRDRGWPHGGVINIVQGEDMGMRSLIRAEISEIAGSSIRASGTARIMNDAWCLIRVATDPFAAEPDAKSTLTQKPTCFQ